MEPRSADGGSRSFDITISEVDGGQRVDVPDMLGEETVEHFFITDNGLLQLRDVEGVFYETE